MATTDVTVLGANGTTVTIPFTSATNAAAAQAALFTISQDVTGGTLTQVNYTGGATLPAVSTPLGGVIAASSVSGLSPFSIGGQYISAVQGGAGDQSIIVNFGSNNAIVASGAGGSTVSGSSGTPTVVSGAGGAEVGNLGTNTQVFFGGAAIQNFSELGVGSSNPTATVWVTTPVKGTANFDDSSGSTTINLDTVAAASTGAHPFGQVLIINDSGTGQTTINVTSNTSGGLTDGDGMSFRGGTTTVNAAGGADSLGAATGGVSLWALLKSGNAFINGNGSDVFVFPSGTGVSATLVGGSGTDVIIGADGLYTGGSAGGNVMYGGFDANATTLIGGGNNDVLVSQGDGTQLFAGAGNENLFAVAPDATFHGDNAAQTAPSKLTLMDGLTGGDTYITGNATGSGGGTSIFSVNDSNGGNLFQEGVAGVNNATIVGFASGTDTLSLSDPISGTYSLIGNTTTAPTAGQVAFQYVGSNTQVSFGDGTTWTILNAQVQNSDFH